MKVTRTQLNGAMQAVDVFFDIDGKELRAIIPREVLEGQLKSQPSPQGWLRACVDHNEELHAIIEKKLATRTQDFVVVRTSDFK